jgi:hypothetical protein
MSIAIILMIEIGATLGWIKNTYFDHVRILKKNM